MGERKLNFRKCIVASTIALAMALALLIAYGVLNSQEIYAGEGDVIATGTLDPSTGGCPWRVIEYVKDDQAPGYELQIGTEGQAFSIENRDYYNYRNAESGYAWPWVWYNEQNPNKVISRVKFCGQVTILRKVNGFFQKFGVGVPGGIESLDLTDVDCSKVNDMDYMFEGARIKHLDVGNLGSLWLNSMQGAFENFKGDFIDLTEFGIRLFIKKTVPDDSVNTGKEYYNIEHSFHGTIARIHFPPFSTTGEDDLKSGILARNQVFSCTDAAINEVANFYYQFNINCSVYSKAEYESRVEALKTALNRWKELWTNSYSYKRGEFARTIAAYNAAHEYLETMITADQERKMKSRRNDLLALKESEYLDQDIKDRIDSKISTMQTFGPDSTKDDADALIADFDQLIEEASSIIEEATFSEAKSALGNELAQAAAFIDKRNDYTDDSFDPFEAAYNDAETAYNSDTATSEEIVAKTNALKEAMENLVEAVRITFISDGEEYVKTKIAKGSAATKPEDDPVKVGHSFNAWFEDSGLEYKWNFTRTLDADKSLYAGFTVNKYKMTFKDHDGNIITEQSLDYGSSITPPSAPVREGHTFIDWSPRVPDTVPAEDMEFKAEYDDDEFTISFDTDGGTPIAPIKLKYEEEIKVPADPTKDGYRFDGWDPAIPGTMPAKDIIVKAKWTKVASDGGNTPGGNQGGKTGGNTPSGNQGGKTNGGGQPTPPPATPGINKIPAEVSPTNPAALAAVTKAIASAKNDNDLKGSTYAPFKFQSKKQTAKSIKLQWGKVKGAKKYTIYGNLCGKNKKYQKIATVKASKKSINIKKVAGKKLKKGANYKFLIIAENGDKVHAVSKTLHIRTAGNKKFANHKSVYVKKATLEKAKKLKKGKTLKLAAKAVAPKGKKVSKHVNVRYESSNKKVATVTKAGKVKAVKKGSAKIYCYAQNGVARTVTVKVK